jgi:hypothetical protein
VLQVRVDLPEAGPGEIVQQVVALKPGPPAADLNQPWPHRRRRRIDGDRPGREELGTGQQVIAGDRTANSASVAPHRRCRVVDDKDLDAEVARIAARIAGLKPETPGGQQEADQRPV